MDRGTGRAGAGREAGAAGGSVGLRGDALDVFDAAVKAADPYEAVKRHVERVGGELLVDGPCWRTSVRLPRAGEGRVVVVGGGKGSAPMAKALEEILGERLDVGIVCVKDGHGLELEKVEVVEGAHPVPDARGCKAGRRIHELVSGCSSEDLVIGAISGGGSALLTLPAEGVTLEDMAVLTDALLSSGATITEINCFRKHLSKVKGGRLGAAAYPARVLNLALSDVVGDPLDVIGSGPFSGDVSTWGDAVAVVERYGIKHKIPESVQRMVELGADGELPETPKPGDPIFDNVVHCVVGSNRLSLEAAAARAKALAYEPVILTSSAQGEAREVAKVFGAVVREVCKTGDPVSPPAAVLMGGETTVTIAGQGKGGRNQELALALAFELDGLGGVVALSGGTDGTDGPTDAAGGVVDGATLAMAESLGLDPFAFLSDNDSYNFFDRLGGLIRTGPTRTNVMDVQLALISAR